MKENAVTVKAVRGLEWVRLDTAFPRNPKILELEYMNAWRAITVYVCGLAYSGEQGLDGFIPDRAMRTVYATKKEIEQLLEVGLWHRDDRGGGYDINDWHDYQPSAEQAERRREKARNAAEERWKKERNKQLRAVVTNE